MSKGPAKDPNRVQLRLPDDILNTLTAPQLGTKLKQYLNNGIELSAPLVSLLNNANKNAKIEILLSLLLANLAVEEGDSNTQAAKPVPKKSSSKGSKSETVAPPEEGTAKLRPEVEDDDYDDLK